MYFHIQKIVLAAQNLSQRLRSHATPLTQLVASRSKFWLYFKSTSCCRMLVCPCRAHQPNELFINQFNVHTHGPWLVQRLAEMDGTRLDWCNKAKGRSPHLFLLPYSQSCESEDSKMVLGIILERLVRTQLMSQQLPEIVKV